MFEAGLSIHVIDDTRKANIYQIKRHAEGLYSAVGQYYDTTAAAWKPIAYISNDNRLTWTAYTTEFEGLGFTGDRFTRVAYSYNAATPTWVFSGPGDRAVIRSSDLVSFNRRDFIGGTIYTGQYINDLVYAGWATTFIAGSGNAGGYTTNTFDTFTDISSGATSTGTMVHTNGKRWCLTDPYSTGRELYYSTADYSVSNTFRADSGIRYTAGSTNCSNGNSIILNTGGTGYRVGPTFAAISSVAIMGGTSLYYGLAISPETGAGIAVNNVSTVAHIYSTSNDGYNWGLDYTDPTEIFYTPSYDAGSGGFILGMWANATGLARYATTETQAVSGTVLDSSGLPASRAVRLYQRSTGVLLGTTTSDPVTGAYSYDVSTHIGQVDAVALADDVAEGHVYNDKIHRLIPA